MKEIQPRPSAMRSGGSVSGRAQVPSPSLLRMAKILIIDPEPRIADAFARILVALGHEVESGASLEAVKGRLEDGATDLIVADAHIPVEKLRPAGSGDRPVVIMMSLFPEKPVLLQALRGGAFRFLTKPVTAKVLREAVTEALETSSVGR
jgi:two-component system, NtrC family, response regulator AtoC